MKSIRKNILVTLGAIILLVGSWAGLVGVPWLQGIQAYLYAFPLVMMDQTRTVSCAVPEAGYVKAPINQFAVMDHYPDDTFRLIPRTGLDTLFAVAWADLNEEPMVLSVPDTADRYYVIALFDYWSNVFASIGKRTTGTGAGNYLIAGPGWEGETPADVKDVYRSPTRYVWVNAQMRANGPGECTAVTALQKQYRLTPLSQWGSAFSPPSIVAVDPAVDTARSPAQQLAAMDAETFFTRFVRVMADNPPAPADAPMVKKLKRLGIEPNTDFDFADLSSRQKKNLERAMGGFKLLEKGAQNIPSKKGWAELPPTIARWGTDYLNRAAIALIGLGAVWPEDVSYPVAFKDVNDKPLDAANRYRMHFEKGQLPPAHETWSVSIYDPSGFYVPNALNRFNLSSWMPLKYNPDGSLDLYIQTASPGADKEANWLPAPASGPFNLVIRIFHPEEAALNGAWKKPAVQRIEDK